MFHLHGRNIFYTLQRFVMEKWPATISLYLEKIAFFSNIKDSGAQM
jgi:hypothetical protein